MAAQWPRKPLSEDAADAVWGHAVQKQGKHNKGAGSRATAREIYPGGIPRLQPEALRRADLLDRSPSVLRLVNAALTADALVDATELTLLATLTGTASTATTDHVWGS